MPSSRFGIDRNNLDGVQLGMAHQIAHACIVPFGIDEYFKNGVRLMAQLGDDGVKTVNEVDL